MINILFDCPNTQDFVNELSEYFHAGDKVAVVAFSFYDNYVHDAESWERVFGYGGNCYFETVDGLAPFGIKPEDISFINYFTDTKESARQKIEAADIIYFTGGLPDRMMDRIREFDLVDTLQAFNGIVFGYSAGAVIQLKEYHLYPDGDYKDYGYYTGLGYLDDLYLEVHYEYKSEQDESIRRVLCERSLPVYITHTRLGGIVIDKNTVKVIGRVDLYEEKTK
jgi:peptidase E